MPLARSKITAQAQISVPAEVRKRLGVGPGSTIEWDVEGARLVVRKAGAYGLEDTRRALGFSRPPKRRALAALRESLRARARARHARG